jgi:hypothetical protein
MTTRLDRWKRGAPFALSFMLLVLSGLAGCTSGMSALGEPPAASDVDVDPWEGGGARLGNHPPGVVEPHQSRVAATSRPH